MKAVILQQMTKRQLSKVLNRKPFLPLLLYLTDGRRILIQEEGTALVMRDAILVVYPVSPKSREITGKDVIAFELIERVDQVQ